MPAKKTVQVEEKVDVAMHEAKAKAHQAVVDNYKKMMEARDEATYAERALDEALEACK